MQAARVRASGSRAPRSRLLLGWARSKHSGAPRRLLLAGLDWTRPKDPPISLGAASIAATLANSSPPVEVLHRSWAVNRSAFDAEAVVDWAMANDSPSADFGIGAFVWNEAAVQWILTQLRRRRFSGRLVVGGPQVSYVASGVEAYYPQADVLVRGYAEQALHRLLASREETPAIAGVHYKGQVDLGLSARTHLHELASPYLQGTVRPQPFIRWETQRGCPFRCAFCQHRQRDAESLRGRTMPIPRIQREAEFICAHPVISDIAVLDPTFNSGATHLGTLAALADCGYRGRLSLQCRAELLSSDFLDAVERLDDGGARCVLEFGLQTVHPAEQALVGRRNRLEAVDAALAACAARGISYEISLMYGLPAQTVGSFEQSLEWCLRRAACVRAFPLMLLRGTPLHARRRELGLVESVRYNHWLGEGEQRVAAGIPHVVASPSFTTRDWLRMVELARDACG